MKPFTCPCSLVVFLLSLLLSSSSSSSLANNNNNNNLTLSPHQEASHDLVITLPQVSGPESLAFDCNGDGPYAGVSDGRILKWSGIHKGWLEFALTSSQRNRKLCDGSTDRNNEPKCGRPLGLKFDTKTCNLYIADAYFGLLMVGPNGGVAQQLATSADDGVPFKFLNALDVDDQTGVVYFSDSSTLFQRREYQVIVLTGDKTGRLLKYDPTSNKAQVLLNGLAFPNGVALSQDGSFLLLAETTFNIILKVWLKGSKSYTSELFAVLERSPDNIKRNKNGDFWVALNSYRAAIQTATKSNARFENQTEIPWRKEDPVGMKFDEKGLAIKVLDGRGGKELNSVSEVEEHGGRLWIGSIDKSYVAVLNL